MRVVLQLRFLPTCVKLTTEASHHMDFILDYPGRSRVITRFILIEVCENLFNLLVSVFSHISECSANASSNILSTLLFIPFWDPNVDIRPLVIAPRVIARSFCSPCLLHPVAQVDDFYYPFLITERGNCKIP